MHNFRDLTIWKRSMDLTKSIYEITAEFPSAEKFGLVSQMRRAAVSVPSNIAEGCSRTTEKHFKQFLAYAKGSLYELETQYLLAKNLGFVNSKSDQSEEIIELQNMIYGFEKSLK